MQKRRRTKIIATLGPATEEPGVLEKLIAAGVDLVRLNFSHGNAEKHKQQFEQVRQVAQRQEREVAILADLQGPKIRIAKFTQGHIQLRVGQQFCLDSAWDASNGNEAVVGIDYKQLVQDVKKSDRLLLDDGRIVLTVVEIKDTQIRCLVTEGGQLSDNKGINREGGGLSAPALTDKDMSDIDFAAKLPVDYIAVSFVRHPDDLNQVRARLRVHESQAGVIAKIERVEALHNLDDIIHASDGVMIARGDLGVEIGDAKLAGVQKNIISHARALDKAVITATQMMESMIDNSLPTRAEVFDVANAVLDGTDAVMLSAETAVGQYPDKAIESMDRICFGAEQEKISQVSKHRLASHFEGIDEAIAMAAMYVANHLDVAAILAYTESGSTPLWMSRIRSGIPIYGFCRHNITRRKMTLYRGVYPIRFDVTQLPAHEINRHALRLLLEREIVSLTDAVIITHGDVMGRVGGSNTMRVVNVGEVLN